MNKKIICIVCPIGCVIEVKCKAGKITSIKGDMCEKGEIYTREEILNPKRVLTTTVKVKNGDEKLLSVKTNKPVSKSKLKFLVKKMSKTEVEAPVKMGQKIFKNIIEDVDVVATKSIKAL